MEESKKLIRFDWFIKKMLRDKSNYTVLEGFLTALLKKDITILNILESESNQETGENKYNRVDILVEDSDHEKIIVEIQNEREADYLERVLFGTSKVIVDYFKPGEEYKEISKVISVSILYFNLGVGNDYIYYGTTEFYGVHTKEKLQVKSKVVSVDAFGSETIAYEKKRNIFPEYYLINVERFKNIVEEDIDEWVYMLKNSEIKKEFKSKYIKEAELQLNLSQLDRKALRQYEKHLEAIAIERDVLSTAKQEGWVEGRIEGRREGFGEGKMGIARNMLMEGIPVALIVKMTELTEAEITQLQNEMKDSNH